MAETLSIIIRYIFKIKVDNSFDNTKPEPFFAWSCCMNEDEFSKVKIFKSGM